MAAFPMDVSYRISEDEYVEAFVHARRRVYGYRPLIVGLIITLVGFLLLWVQIRDAQAFGMMSIGSMLAQLVAFGLPGFLIGYGLNLCGDVWFLPAIARQRYRDRLRDFPISVRTDANGIDVSTEGVRSHMDWSAICGVENTPNTVMIFYDRFDYLLVPKSGFSPPETARDFYEQCKAHCPACPDEREFGFPVVQPRA